MAGDWIKMRNDLVDDPSVIGIAAKTGLDEFAVIGRLQCLWAWADEQSRDGHAVGVTCAWLNRKVQCDGFAEAMRDVQWLIVTADGIQIPNFERHNGKTAKTRALSANRQQTRRANVTREVTEESLYSSRSPSRSQRDNIVTREEKRREESNTPPNPRKRGTVHEFPPGFVAFWEAYPRKVGKDAAAKAFAKRRPDHDLLVRMLEALAEQIESDQWRRDGGQYIPHPATWLNAGRWQDEAITHGRGVGASDGRVAL